MNGKLSTFRQCCAAVLGNLDQPVVGAGVDQAFHQGRLGEGDDRPVKRGRVVLGHGVHTPDPAHDLELVAVDVASQVGADRLPVVAAIIGTKEDLGAIVRAALANAG